MTAAPAPASFRGRLVSAALGYAMPNPAAIALLDPEVANDPYIFVPREMLARCRLLPDFGEFNKQLLEAWTRLKAE